MKVARALASCIYDIENDMILTSKIDHYTTSERDLAKSLIEQLKDLGLKNDLILFDRGYPSSELIGYLENENIKYLIRVSKIFFKEVNEARENDQIIKVNINKKEVEMLKLGFFGLC